MAKYDLVIIGSGPGGYVAAIRASQWGLKTAVVEKDPFLGGTCLHVGCIPTKVLLHHADIYDYFQRAEEFGFEVKDVKINWPAMLTRKDKIVKKHAGGIGLLFQKNKVDSITGWGRIVGPGKVSVEKDGQITEIETTYTMIATGSEARTLPGVEIDGNIILSNREILQLATIPKSLIIVGAGAVGVEFASIFRTFGTEVTLLEALPRIVPLEDEDISPELEKAFKKTGIRIETGAKVEFSHQRRQERHRHLHGQNRQIAIHLRGQGFDRRGPPPSYRKLRHRTHESKARARLHSRQRVHGNRRAAPLRHRRYRRGHAAARARGFDGRHHRRRQHGRKGRAAIRSHCAAPPPPTASRRSVPSASPRNRRATPGYDVKTGKFPFLANSKATILGSHDGFIKVVAEAKYGEVLGVHAIGPLTTEIIAEAVTALSMEATLDDMAALIHAHPTVWEAMGDAFNSVRGLTINF